MNFTELATANFTGTDLAELGASWDSGYSNGVAFRILTNRAQPNTFNSVAYESYNGITWPNNQYSEIDIVSTWGGENIAGVMLRAANPSTDTFYVTYVYAFTSGTDTGMEIAKSIANSYTTLANDTASAWVAGDRIKGAVLETGLYLFKNGSEILAASDSDISSGRGGMYALYFGAGGNVFLDNWAGGEVEGDAPASLPHHLLLLGVGR